MSIKCKKSLVNKVFYKISISKIFTTITFRSVFRHFHTKFQISCWNSINLKLHQTDLGVKWIHTQVIFTIEHNQIFPTKTECIPVSQNSILIPLHDEWGIHTFINVCFNRPGYVILIRISKFQNYCIGSTVNNRSFSLSCIRKTQSRNPKLRLFAC